MVAFFYTADLIFTREQIKKLITDKSLGDLYNTLLSMVKTDMDTIVFDSFERLRKHTSYKTKSGLWKALKRLEQLELISLQKDREYKHRLFITGSALELSIEKKVLYK